MTLGRWLVPIATGVAGLVVGWLLASPGEPRPGAPGGSAVMPLFAAREAGPVPQLVTIDDVRRVLREELAARGSAAPGDVAASVSPPAASPEQQAAAMQAEAVLAAAIARRSWTDADGEAMRESFESLGPDQQAELLREFSVAVNQGRLIPQTERIPF